MYLDYYSLPRSQPAKRHSNRKRKANQSQASVMKSDPRVNEARQLMVLLLEVTTETMMVGLSDGELQMEIAQWAGTIAESGERVEWITVTMVHVHHFFLPPSLLPSFLCL